MKKQRCISAKEKDGSLRILNLLSENEKTRDRFLQKLDDWVSAQTESPSKKKETAVDFPQKQKSMEADLCTTQRNSSSKITKKKKKEEEEENETAMDFFCRKNPRLSAQTEKTLSEK
jgi:hypothetical protein